MIEVTLEKEKLNAITETETWVDKKTGENRSKEVIKFQLQELRDEKKDNRFSNDNVSIVKTHYAQKKQSKDERQAKAEKIFVGEGVTFTFREQGNFDKVAAKPDFVKSDDDDSDLPF